MPANIDPPSASFGRSGWLKGCLRAMPIVFGYLPVGFAYGILAQKSGLSVFNALMMSVIVFAGASQFIAVGLMAAGAFSVFHHRHHLRGQSTAPHHGRGDINPLELLAALGAGGLLI